MSERKSLNKYYGPDYDPIAAEKTARKLSKKLKNHKKDITSIRLMTPFSMRCMKCDEYIPQSRKFNGKKELLPERYLNNIKMYRLSIRCPRCANSITFRTDPKSADYAMENGGIRNYVKKDKEALKNKDETIDETLERLAKEQEEEEAEKEKAKNKNSRNNNNGEDKMAVLEERLVKLQREQENAEEIEKLRKLNYERMQRADTLWNEDSNQKDKEAETDRNTIEVDRLTDEAFNHHINDNNNIKQEELNTVDDVRTNTDELLNVKKLIMNKTKIKMKKNRAGKVNSLGIIVKKKK